MRLAPICRRVSRRALRILGGGMGLVLVGTADCTDDLSGAVFTSLEGLATEVVSILFQSIEFGDTATNGGSDTVTTTVQAITHSMGCLLC